MKAIQISQIVQDLKTAKEIATLAKEMNPEEIQVPVKKANKTSSFKPSEEAKVKKIDLLTGDPEKTTIINSELDPK